MFTKESKYNLRNAINRILLFIAFMALSFTSYPMSAKELPVLFKYINGADSSYTLFLFQGYNESKDNNFKLAASHLSELIKISIEKKDIVSQAHYLNLMGSLYYEHQQFQVALEYYFRCSEILSNKSLDIATAYNRGDIANVYYAQELYDEAKKEYRFMYRVFQKTNTPHGIAVALNNLGLVSEKQNKLDSALFFYENAKKVRLKMKEPDLLIHSDLYIANVYLKLNNLTAVDSLVRKVKIDLKNYTGNSILIPSQWAKVFWIEAQNYRKQEKISQSKKAYKSAIEKFKTINDYKACCLALIELATIYSKEGNSDSALIEYENAFNIAKTGELGFLQRDVLSAKLMIYLKQENADKSQLVFNEYRAISDSILYNRNKQRAEEFGLLLKAREQDKMLIKYQIETNADRKQFYISVISFSIILLVLLGLVITIKRSQKRLLQLANAANEGIVIIQRGKIIMVNSQFLELVESSEKTVLKHSLKHFIPSKELHARLNSNESIIGFKTQIRSINQKFTDVSIQSRPFRHNRADAIILSVHDLSAINNATNENTMLWTAINQNASQVIITNKTGVIEYANAKVVEITGYQINELLGKTPAVLKSGHTPNENYRELWNTILKGEIWQGIFENKRCDGSLYTEKATITPVKDHNGNITHFIALKEDITQLKKAEEAIRLKDQMYRELSRNLPDTAVFLYNTDLIYELAEGPLLARAGFFRESFEGRKIGLMATDEDRLEILSAMKRALNGEATVLEKIIHNIPCLIQIQGLRDEKGNIGMGMVVYRDISLQIENLNRIESNEKRLKELNQTKDKFFSILSHDLKNPFNIILGYTQLLQNDYYNLDDNTRIFYTSQIHHGADSAYKLLNNLLEWSRSQVGAIALKQSFFVIDEPLYQTLPLLTIQAQQKGIEIVNNSDTSVIVFADIYMVKTIFRNLISNAIKFSYPGSKIEISLTKKEGRVHLYTEYLEIAIRDQGIGMSEDTISKLFTLGESIRNTGTANETGTGLGLIICYDFIRRMDENIWVESTPRSGTTFYFTLPTGNNHI